MKLNVDLTVSKILHDPKNSKAEKMRRGEPLGGRGYTSFQDYEWACGHTGPAACLQCAEDWQREKNDLKAEVALLKKRLRERTVTPEDRHE